MLTAEDERSLTPPFWSHVLPYGEVELDMNSRLALSGLVVTRQAQMLLPDSDVRGLSVRSSPSRETCT
ncbi:hypothetical protein [Nocardia bhagyanarayanae]|uniref:hypothetical protein n=1 Tax=Nocardia bhagyanarayanae TaxID=1215925 RepID=UPI001639895A|nr:hypothetical protein [Nocardia bhagyanarayanae]